MMKSSKVTLIVDSIESAVKFYTEKLSFDIIEICAKKEEDGSEVIHYAQIKKGKCFIMFRLPHVEEQAEFSFIKRCANRCTGLYVEMKKGLDKYFSRCNKKGVPIIHEVEEQPWGDRTFSIKDPFGFLLTFAQPIENFVAKETLFCGLPIKKTTPSGQPRAEEDLINEMVQHLKYFRIARRFAKKYAKVWLKQNLKK